MSEARQKASQARRRDTSTLQVLRLYGGKDVGSVGDSRSEKDSESLEYSRVVCLPCLHWAPCLVSLSE